MARIAKLSSLTPDQLEDYNESKVRCDKMADDFIQSITTHTKPGDVVDYAAAQHALTIVSGFFLKQAMASFPDEGKYLHLDAQRDELVAEMLNNIRILAYEEGAVVVMPFYQQLSGEQP